MVSLSHGLDQSITMPSTFILLYPTFQCRSDVYLLILMTRAGTCLLTNLGALGKAQAFIYGVSRGRELWWCWWSKIDIVDIFKLNNFVWQKTRSCSGYELGGHIFWCLKGSVYYAANILWSQIQVQEYHAWVCMDEWQTRRWRRQMLSLRSLSFGY